VTVFVDTSALFALLDRDADGHAAAAATFDRLLADEPLITHNYVVVEAEALARSRLGLAAARDLLDRLLAPIEIHWVDAATHAAGVAALLAAARRDLSLVDCVSFEVMRRLAVPTAFAFDRDFEQAGFRTLP
jgi:predicted nucleic acid-binding protein